MSWLENFRNMLKISQDVPEELLRKSWELFPENFQELVPKNIVMEIPKNFPKSGRHFFLQADKLKQSIYIQIYHCTTGVALAYSTILLQSVHTFYIYIYILCLSVSLSVCLFVFNTRQNGLTDRAQIQCDTSHDPTQVYE